MRGRAENREPRAETADAETGVDYSAPLDVNFLDSNDLDEELFWGNDEVDNVLRETKYWLRMVAVSVTELQDDARGIWREAKELNLIFGAIYRKK